MPTMQLVCLIWQIIRTNIGVDNAAILYGAAVRFEACDLAEFCFQLYVQEK
jgi:hypothetical protein